MTADLTFNTIAFKKTFDMKDQSERSSITRGVNIPDKLLVKHQSYVDSTNKVSGKRRTFRVDRYDLDANGVTIVTSAYAVIVVPSTATQAQLDNVVATFKAVVADASFIPAVENGET